MSHPVSSCGISMTRKPATAKKYVHSNYNFFFPITINNCFCNLNNQFLYEFGNKIVAKSKLSILIDQLQIKRSAMPQINSET